MKLQEQIYKIMEMMNKMDGGKIYIDWDTNYGKAFKLVHTPKGRQSGEWDPSLVSIVTPENGDAWVEWEELSPKKLKRWKTNWDEVQKNLVEYKYDQIIRSMNRENFT